MNLFKQLFSELSGMKSIREAIEKNISPVSVTGLSHIHRAQLAGSLPEGRIHLVITGSEAEAKKREAEKQARKAEGYNKKKSDKKDDGNNKKKKKGGRK